MPREIVREVMPNGMPFILQGEIVEYKKKSMYSLKNIKMYPILFKDDDTSNGMILEDIPFQGKRQKKILASRLIKYWINKK